MKKTIIALLVLPTFSAFATEQTDALALAKIEQARAQWTKEHFAKQGSPMPDGGITILPKRKMAFASKSSTDESDIAKYGYIKKPSPEAQTLLNLKSNKSPASEHGKIYENIHEIQMAYDFKGVPENSVDMIGVVPYLSFIQGKGWVGASQLFEKSGLGTCTYSQNNIKLTHASVVIAEEVATKEVNGKVTVSHARGDKSTGFIYSVDWYDNSFFHELKCAKSEFSQNTLQDMAIFAQEIDANI